MSFDPMNFYRQFPAGGNTDRGDWLERCLKAMCEEAVRSQLYVYPAWIPCSERMPPANQDVLFWEPRGMGYGYKDVDDPDSRRWIDKLSSDRDGDYCDTFEVTHWMPLPSGPISGQSK